MITGLNKKMAMVLVLLMAAITLSLGGCCRDLEKGMEVRLDEDWDYSWSVHMYDVYPQRDRPCDQRSGQHVVASGY